MSLLDAVQQARGETAKVQTTTKPTTSGGSILSAVQQARGETAPVVQPAKVSSVKSFISTAGQAIKGFIQQVPSVAKTIVKKPKIPIVGAGTAILSFGASIASAVQRGIASVTKKPIPERWDMSKQSKAFEELVKMNLGAEEGNEQKAFETGKFIGQIIPYSLSSELATLTIGSKVLIPAVTKLAPKLVKVVPLINNAVGFAGIGQLTYEPGDETRVDRLKSDLITLAVFETGGFLAKGISKQTSKLISKTIKGVKVRLTSGKLVAIDEVENLVRTAKEAVVKDTGKQPQSLFLNNLDKASEKEIQTLTPKAEVPKAKATKVGLSVPKGVGEVKPQISAKPSRVGEGLKVTPQARKVVTPPVGEGAKPSKIGIDIEAKAIEKRLTKSFGGTAEYTPTTIKEQSKIIANLTKDMEKVKRIFSGEEPLPSNVKIGMLYKEMEEYALKKGDMDMLMKMAKSPLTSETSFYAQELRFLAERETGSPVKTMSEVIKVREKAFEQRYKGRTQKELVDKTIKEIKSKIKAPDKYDWNVFLNSIVCK